MCGCRNPEDYYIWFVLGLGMIGAALLSLLIMAFAGLLMYTDGLSCDAVLDAWIPGRRATHDTPNPKP